MDCCQWSSEQVFKALHRRSVHSARSVEIVGECQGIAMVSGDEGGVYLMPALLPHLDSDQVSKSTVSQVPH